MENAPDTSVLRVAVTTALGAQPLENALVTVSTAPDENGTRTLLYAVRTDRDGMTPPMTLAAPPRSASLSPVRSRPTRSTRSRPRGKASCRSPPCT